MTVLLVSGTGTHVGKTVVTAAVAAVAARQGKSVAVVKPAQTGCSAGQAGDVDEVGRLSGLCPPHLHELARYPDPLSPEAAARVCGEPAPALNDVVATVRQLSAAYELVLVEGSGGLLVRFASDGWTLADLAAALQAPVVIVTAAVLGTLNATALTLASMAARDLRSAGLVIGSWPRRPDLATRCNLVDLPVLAGEPLAGVLPEGAASRPDFLGLARRGLGPRLGGDFDAADFTG
ncbi:MAG: dethiobiotin synthase [Pseudonocardiales bacterium]